MEPGTKAKTSSDKILEDISILQSRQELITKKVVLNLPSLNNLNNIQDTRTKLQLLSPSDNTTEPQHDTEQKSVNRLSMCFTPPYSNGASIIITAHPRDMMGRLITDIYNTFSSADYLSGEISLSAISGQNLDEIYSGLPFHFSDDNLCYYHTSWGLIQQDVNLAEPFASDSIVEVILNTEMPSDGMIDLKPGPLSSNLYGIAGVEGFINMVISHGSTMAKTDSSLFLSAWQTWNSPFNMFYKEDPEFRIKFLLPGGVSHFSIKIYANINAYSANQYPIDNGFRQEYSLIDFRAKKFKNWYKIFRTWISGEDHVPQGSIKINNICLKIDPAYIKLPDVQ